ncbi:MAG TPA: GntR family transcriptional regulator [Rhizobiaceae bacterium]|nr:GntR family transcriptional regulator [Rhizobiaceae bacterium]
MLRLKDPIAPQLVLALRDSIVRMQIKPGEALSEKHVAERYGVSRQPVREAFIKLSEAGLVEIRPSRGTYVLKISVSEVANARFVREAIECDIARRAARMADPARIAALDDMLAAQRTAAGNGDHLLFNEHDEAFHRAIGDIVDCDFAWKVVEGARKQTDRVRFLSLSEASPMPRLIEQHASIVDRLREGDSEGAAAAMSRHLREILIALPRVAKAHPDLFSDMELPAHTIGLVPEAGRA